MLFHVKRTTTDPFKKEPPCPGAILAATVPDRSSNGEHYDWHIEIEDLSGLLALRRVVKEPLVIEGSLRCEHDIPTLEIYDDWRE